MPPVLRKITQTDLGEYIALQAAAEKYLKHRKDIIERHGKGAEVESGELSLQITTEKGTSVSYAGAIEAFLKERPTLVKAFETMKRKFTKPKTSHEVVITGSESIA